MRISRHIAQTLAYVLVVAACIYSVIKITEHYDNQSIHGFKQATMNACTTASKDVKALDVQDRTADNIIVIYLRAALNTRIKVYNSTHNKAFLTNIHEIEQTIYALSHPPKLYLINCKTLS